MSWHLAKMPNANIRLYRLKCDTVSRSAHSKVPPFEHSHIRPKEFSFTELPRGQATWEYHGHAAHLIRLNPEWRDAERMAPGIWGSEPFVASIEDAAKLAAYVKESYPEARDLYQPLWWQDHELHYQRAIQVPIGMARAAELVDVLMGAPWQPELPSSVTVAADLGTDVDLDKERRTLWAAQLRFSDWPSIGFYEGHRDEPSFTHNTRRFRKAKVDTHQGSCLCNYANDLALDLANKDLPHVAIVHADQGDRCQSALGRIIAANDTRRFYVLIRTGTGSVLDEARETIGQHDNLTYLVWKGSLADAREDVEPFDPGMNALLQEMKAKVPYTNCPP